MVSNRTLAKIATYGGMITLTGAMYVHWKIQDGLKRSEYLKEALKLMRNHKGAVQLMGEPMKMGNLNLGDNTNNFCDGSQAQFQVPVKGPNNKGTLFLWARRETPQQNWTVNRLELEFKDDPTKRLIIKKGENSSEVET